MWSHECSLRLQPFDIDSLQAFTDQIHEAASTGVSMYLTFTIMFDIIDFSRIPFQFFLFTPQSISQLSSFCIKKKSLQNHLQYNCDKCQIHTFAFGFLDITHIGIRACSRRERLPFSQQCCEF